MPFDTSVVSAVDRWLRAYQPTGEADAEAVRTFFVGGGALADAELRGMLSALDRILPAYHREAFVADHWPPISGHEHVYVGGSGRNAYAPGGALSQWDRTWLVVEAMHRAGALEDFDAFSSAVSRLPLPGTLLASCAIVAICGYPVQAAALARAGAARSDRKPQEAEWLRWLSGEGEPSAPAPESDFATSEQQRRALAGDWGWLRANLPASRFARTDAVVRHSQKMGLDLLAQITRAQLGELRDLAIVRASFQAWFGYYQLALDDPNTAVAALDEKFLFVVLFRRMFGGDAPAEFLRSTASLVPDLRDPPPTRFRPPPEVQTALADLRGLIAGALAEASGLSRRRSPDGGLEAFAGTTPPMPTDATDWSDL